MTPLECALTGAAADATPLSIPVEVEGEGGGAGIEGRGNFVLTMRVSGEGFAAVETLTERFVTARHALLALGFTVTSSPVELVS